MMLMTLSNGVDDVTLVAADGGMDGADGGMRADSMAQAAWAP